MRFLLSSLLFLLSSVVPISTADDDSKSAPPPFFLIDTTDQLCLAGEEFRRCSIDTLFYVVGAPGKSFNFGEEKCLFYFILYGYPKIVNFLLFIYVDIFALITWQVRIKFTSVQLMV